MRKEVLFIHLYIPWYGFLIIFVCIGFGYAYYFSSKQEFHPYDVMTPLVTIGIVICTILTVIGILIGKFMF